MTRPHVAHVTHAAYITVQQAYILLYIVLYCLCFVRAQRSMLNSRNRLLFRLNDKVAYIVYTCRQNVRCCISVIGSTWSNVVSDSYSNIRTIC